jgi:hypothetical protein
VRKRASSMDWWTVSWITTSSKIRSCKYLMDLLIE